MRTGLRQSEENNKYDGLLISPDTLFDEDWILSKIGNIGTTYTVELAVVQVRGLASIEIKLLSLAKKNPPSMKTKLFRTTS